MSRNHITTADLDRLGFKHEPCRVCCYGIPANSATCINPHCRAFLKPASGPADGLAGTNGTGGAIEKPSNIQKASKPRQPNKTELRFRDAQMEHVRPGLRFEALTLRLANGHKYTPDWVYVTRDLLVQCFEIKDSRYRHASFQRSRLAFDQAATEFPCFRFFWCEWDGNKWTITERTAL